MDLNEKREILREKMQERETQIQARDAVRARLAELEKEPPEETEDE